MSLALVLVSVALYWPARHYEFVEFDDPDYVFENQTVRSGISWYGLAWSVVDAHASNWHPVTWISHMLDCQLFGLQAGAHHLVNVLLHGVNGALLFLLLRAMTGAFWRSALVAALFAWHPLRVESVAWISERKDVLSGFFFMLTLSCYAKYASYKMQPQDASQCSDGASHDSEAQHSESGGEKHSARWYSLALSFFALGLLSKPMLVSVPFLLLILDYWPLARVPWASGARLRLPRALLLEKLPFVVLAIAMVLITVFAQRGAIVPIQAESPAVRVATMFAGYFGYVEKIFWPHALTVLYLRPQSVPCVPLVAGVFLLVGVSVAAILNVRSRPYLAVGGFWFLGMLLPVSGLMQAGLQSLADRYTYLPAIGLSLIVAWGLQELAAAALPAQGGRAILGTVVACVLIACLGLTRHQLAYWRNTQTLMDHALELDPNNYVAHQNLGRYYSKLGQAELARAHRQKVRELDPALGTESGRIGGTTTVQKLDMSCEKRTND
jgi:hypothetical protein